MEIISPPPPPPLPISELPDLRLPFWLGHTPWPTLAALRHQQSAVVDLTSEVEHTFARRVIDLTDNVTTSTLTTHKQSMKRQKPQRQTKKKRPKLPSHGSCVAFVEEPAGLLLTYDDVPSWVRQFFTSSTEFRTLNTWIRRNPRYLLPESIPDSAVQLAVLDQWGDEHTQEATLSYARRCQESGFHDLTIVCTHKTGVTTFKAKPSTVGTSISAVLDNSSNYVQLNYKKQKKMFVSECGFYRLQYPVNLDEIVFYYGLASIKKYCEVVGSCFELIDTIASFLRPRSLCHGV
jgi:hypothetical protein